MHCSTWIQCVLPSFGLQWNWQKEMPVFIYLFYHLLRLFYQGYLSGACGWQFRIAHQLKCTIHNSWKCKKKYSWQAKDSWYMGYIIWLCMLNKGSYLVHTIVCWNIHHSMVWTNDLLFNEHVCIKVNLQWLKRGRKQMF